MPTLVLDETFDSTTGSPDQTANVTWVATPAYEGGGSVSIADGGYWIKNAVGTSALTVKRAWIRFSTLPDVDLGQLFGVYYTGSGQAGFGFDVSESKFCLVIVGEFFAAEGPSVSADTWYRLDLKVDYSSTDPVVDGQVNGTAFTQRTRSDVADGPFNATDYRVGDYATTNIADIYMDRLSVSNTAGDYPLGGLGQVLLPDADTAAGGWINELGSASPLYSKVADSSDTTYIVGTAS